MSLIYPSWPGFVNWKKRLSKMHARSLLVLIRKLPKTGEAFLMEDQMLEVPE